MGFWPITNRSRERVDSYSRLVPHNHACVAKILSIHIILQSILKSIYVHQKSLPFFFNVVNIVAKRKFLHQKPKIQKMFKNIYSAASHTNYELVLPCHLPPISCNLNKFKFKFKSHTTFHVNKKINKKVNKKVNIDNQ